MCDVVPPLPSTARWSAPSTDHRQQSNGNCSRGRPSPGSSSTTLLPCSLHGERPGDLFKVSRKSAPPPPQTHTHTYRPPKGRWQKARISFRGAIIKGKKRGLGRFERGIKSRSGNFGEEVLKQGVLLGLAGGIPVTINPFWWTEGRCVSHELMGLKSQGKRQGRCEDDIMKRNGKVKNILPLIHYVKR